MRTPEEFKQQAIKKNILKFPVRECSICGSGLSYHFFDNAEIVAWSGSCDCSPQDYGGLEPRDWQDVADFCNMQRSQPIIDKHNKFWGFDEMA